MLNSNSELVEFAEQIKLKMKVDSEKKPAHGFCTVCGGPIRYGVKWSLSPMMFRIPADRDDCIAVLHPELYKKFMEVNPNYVSRERY